VAIGDAIALSAAGLPAFLLYLGASLALVALFVLVYVQVTPQREVALLRQGNAAAAISFGGAVLGFVIPLSQAVGQSQNLVDMAFWSVVALVVQIVVFLLANLLVGEAGRKITDGELGAASFLAFMSIGGGLLNAACMTFQ
jgi:putative membrane protein